MQLDPNKLNQLLAMNDEQLLALVGKIAQESGISPDALRIQPQNLTDLRKALGSASNNDLEQLNRVYQEHQHKKT